MRKIWVDEMTHTLPMVCFGTKEDHMVLSPLGAKEIGECLLAAAQQAYDLIQDRQAGVAHLTDHKDKDSAG